MWCGATGGFLHSLAVLRSGKRYLIGDKNMAQIIRIGYNVQLWTMLELIDMI